MTTRHRSERLTSMIRRTWDEIPVRVREEVARRCGDVLHAEPISNGRNSEFAATLYVGDPGERVFVKGITRDHPQVRMYEHEAEINQVLPTMAPRLLWQVDTDGWLMLGFEHVDGRHADLSPGSPDLVLIARVLSRMPETACPISDVPSLAEQWARLAAWRRLRNDPPADLDPWSVENMDRFVSLERRAFDLMDGKSLLHTDLQSLNILMDPAVRIVDWAWSRLGAPWVDTALLVIRLIDAGHSPAEAELWADTVSPWTTASSDARTAFSVAVLGAWEYLQRARPLPHRAQLTAAARQWTRHRLTQSEHA